MNIKVELVPGRVSKPTPAQYEALRRAAISPFSGVWPGDGDTRKDVIARCKEKGWLHHFENCLTAKGFIAWRDYDPEQSALDMTRAMAGIEKQAYIEAKRRADRAAYLERQRVMVKPPTTMTFTFTFNEWFAIMNSLEQATIHYRADMHGVDLMTLRNTIGAKYQSIVEKNKES